MRLAVIHRPRGTTAPALAGTVWSTCLRELAFVPYADADQALAERTLVGEEAYALVLEIVCGLRSPLVGETEVQAQFKAFLSSLDPSTHGWLLQFGQRILADAKSIRHEYLQGLGVGGYGRLALRGAAGARLAIVGAGALAQDILDHAGTGRAIDVWRRRNGDDLLVASGTCRRLLIQDADAEPRLTGSTSLIVAAPVQADALDRIAACYLELADIVDLRASDEVTDVVPRVPRTRLTDLLAHLETSRPKPVALARAAIRERARTFGIRCQLRPFGWDDLCA